MGMGGGSRLVKSSEEGDRANEKKLLVLDENSWSVLLDLRFIVWVFLDLVNQSLNLSVLNAFKANVVQRLILHSTFLKKMIFFQIPLCLKMFLKEEK